MRRRQILFPGLVMLCLVGAVGAKAVAPIVITQVRHARQVVELAAAYPPLRLNEGLITFTTMNTGGQSGGTVRSAHATSATEWFGQPVEARWQWYQQSAQAHIRLLTHVELVVFGIGLLAVLLATVGRGLWFLLMLLVMRRRAQPGTSHGSAHWATGAELAAMRPRPGHADLVLGGVGRQLVALRERDQYEHLLLVAPPARGRPAA